MVETGYTPPQLAPFLPISPTRPNHRDPDRGDRTLTAQSVNRSGARPLKQVMITREQYRALSQFHRAVADVCLERGSGEVILVD